MMRRLLLLALLALTMSVSAQEMPDGAEWPPMGMNLYSPSYYDSMFYFNDITQHGSQWISFNLDDPSVWNDERAFPMDENGYPAELAEDQGVRMILYLEARGVITGEHTLTWTGEGQLAIDHNGGYQLFEPATNGKLTFDFNPPADEEAFLFLMILATNPENPVRNVRVWLPGTENSNSLFTEHFKARLAPFNPIRPMGWNFINDDNQMQHWDERPRRGWYSWALETGPLKGGVPFEVQIDLANELDKDYWVVIPHQATDDFVRQLATLIRDELEPGLRVWVEYTNEHWNPAFSQNHWLYERSEAVRDGRDIDYFLFHEYGRRSVDVLRIFDEVFAEQGQAERLVGVIGGQSGWAYPAEAALAEVAAQGGLALVDTLSLAPYLPNGTEDGAWDLDALMADMDTANLSEEDYAAIFAELDRAVDAVFTPDNEYGLEMHRNRELAEQYGLTLTAYEAGQHLTAFNLENFTPREDVVGLYEQVNARPEMYAIYQRYLDAWRDFGGETMVMFHLGGFWNDVETFGHLAYGTQAPEDAHKYRALIDWLAEAGG